MTVLLVFLVISLAGLVAWLEWENLRAHRMLSDAGKELAEAVGCILAYLKGKSDADKP